MKSLKLTRQVALCTVYAAAMAYVESAVVVYLRTLSGARTKLFPLAPLPPFLLHVELARELATLVMLAAVARLQSRRLRVNLAFFLYCFGIWDLFYYVWLKLAIGWPPSLLSWDVLFLVPVPWFGPVLSPSLVSLFFVAGSLTILRMESLGRPLRFTALDYSSGIAGAALIFVSYLWELPRVARTGLPAGYPWWLFALGAAIWIGMFSRRVLLARPSISDPPALG